MKAVHILVINHRHGSDAWANRSEQGAYDALHRYVAEWWSQEVGGVMPADHQEAVEQYFEEMAGRESYDFFKTELMP